MGFALTARKENGNWHFGCYGGLRFEDGNLEITPSALQRREGTASVSDAAGKLLFYTAGISVFNGNDVKVADGLLGHPSSTSSGVVIPVGGSPDEYWIFTSDHRGGTNGVNYYWYHAGHRAARHRYSVPLVRRLRPMRYVRNTRAFCRSQWIGLR
ncbi:hypothetical protein [Neolewinella xylanilytica]|uniref:hypothetical protein n=1 Tax=Neolewinella xylanilytica TaxID=1514080 RepID=UPI000CEAF1E2|nr:hypothetical protein [Neolewinella xylanilytica]